MDCFSNVGFWFGDKMTGGVGLLLVNGRGVSYFFLDMGYGIWDGFGGLVRFRFANMIRVSEFVANDGMLGGVFLNM